jgi:hypothetical protein
MERRGKKQVKTNLNKLCFLAISLMLCTSLMLVSVRAVSPVNITVDSSPTGLVDIYVDSSQITTPTLYSWTPGNTHTLYAVSPLTYGPNFRRIFLDWSAGSFGTDTSQTITYTVPGYDETVLASYKNQWWIQVNSAHDTPTASAFVDEGTGFTASVTSPDYVSATHRWVCTGYKIDGGALTAGTSYTFTTVSNTHTIDFLWKEQYQVSFTQTGSGVPPVVTYTADTDPTAAVPFSLWVKAGTGLTFSYPAIVPGALGVQYVLTGTNMASPQTVNGPLTIVGTYKTQYYLTVRTYSDGGWDAMIPPPTPPSGWFDAGKKVKLDAPLTAHDAYGNHYNFYGIWMVNGVTHGNPTTITMNSPTLAVAYYCDPPLFGDVNRDNKVDTTDLAVMARHYWTNTGDANYSVLCDLNGDGQINLQDLAALAIAPQA